MTAKIKNVMCGRETSYKCGRCDKQFKDAWKLVEHLYLVHDIPVMCDKTTTTVEGF